ncbi:MAG: hypothetical protein J6A63_09860 [Clostridia bacterium]|nr:hypothetical protein [Clostridia bacterium]
MEENTQKQGEISLFDLFKTLLRKVKLLIVVLLAGIVVGGSVGVLTTANVNYYGTKITFYVNPRKSNTVTENNSQYGVYGAYGAYVMDNMVTLLNSELFAERLTLNPDGLPLDSEGKLLVENAALKILVDAAMEKKAVAKTAEEDSVKAESTIVTAENALKDAQALLAIAEAEEERAKLAAETAAERYENAWEKLGYSTPSSEEELNKLVAEEKLTKEGKQNIMSLGEASDAATSLYEIAVATTTAAFANVSAPETGKQALYEKAVATASSAVAAAKQAANEAADAVETALEKWRETPEYVKLLARNNNSVSFSYYNKEEDSESENLARSFIYVTISVLNDEEGAKNLYEKVMEIVPIFVEENMAIPSGYSGTNCRRITRDDEILHTNAGHMLETAVTYALVAGALAFVAACIIIILMDRSDKRLRNYEQVMENFNVPVLGVIPTIDKDDYPQKEEQKNTEGKDETV